jgi:hypothetical protein
MGQEIVYCDDCRTRLTGQDFEKGGALRVGHRTFCAPCAPSGSKTPPAPTRPPSNSSAPRVRPLPTSRKPRPLALWIALALAALALIVLVVVASHPARNAAPRTEHPAP